MTSNQGIINIQLEEAQKPDRTNVQPTTTVSSSPTTPTELEIATTEPRQSKSYIPAYQILTKFEKRLVFLSLCCGMFLAALDQMIVAVSLPTIAADLKANNYVAWIIAAYLLTSSATMPLYGRYSDIYGRRIVYEWSLVWFLIGSLVCGLSTNISSLIIARGVQGIGAGGLMSLSMILIGDIAKPAVRAKYMSSMSAIFGLATVLGPVLGGIFTSYTSWQWIFWINVPFTLITIVICWRILTKIKNAQKELPIDLVGSILIFSGTICMVLFITWGGDKDIGYAWDSWVIILLILLSILFLCLFLVQEFRHAAPIFNLRLLKIQNFAVSCIVMFLFGMAMLGAFTFLPFYFQNVRGDTALISGFKIFPMVVGLMFCSIFVAVYISKTGKFILFPTIGLGLFAIGTGLLILLDRTMSYNIQWIFLFIIGCGMGFSFPVYNTIVQNSVPPEDMASSISALTFIRLIGGSIGVAIIGSVLNQERSYYLSLGYDYPTSYSKALHPTFTACLIVSILAFLFAFGIKNDNIFARKPEDKQQPIMVEGI